MLIKKLTASMKRANFREAERLAEGKSMVMVGSASVSSDITMAKIETNKPTHREQKNEHKIIRFLGCGLLVKP
jgi:hypothetical protein